MNQDRRARTLDTSIIDIASSGGPARSLERSRHQPLIHRTRAKPQPFWPTPQITPLDSTSPAVRLSALLSTHRGDRLTLKELSTVLGYSEKYASEIFRKYMGVSFSEYIKQQHLAKATQLLNMQHLTIAQIAESVGFSDAFAFSHFFKRAIGCSPSEFRKQHPAEAGLK
jgi:AraC-like DNA-binding protein